MDVTDTTIEQARAERKRQLALGYRVFGALGWGDLGDGHISARDPERTDGFWLLPWNVSYHQATVADLVLVGPVAYHIHWPILMARPELVSAAHVHTPWGTPFAAEARPIEPITQEACLYAEHHAIFDDDEVHIQDLEGGKRIAAALGDHPAIILRNHGLLTVGADVAQAVGGFIQLERIAEAHLKARDAKPIGLEAARYARAGLGGDDAGRYSFIALVARHVPDPSVVD